MATTARTKKKRRSPKGLGETDQPVVVVRNRKPVAETLFKTAGDDSVLKTAVVYTAAAFIAYYGGRMLLGSVSKQREENLLAKEEQKAVTTTGTAAALAGQLKLAISDWGNTDESVVWAIFEGGQIRSKEYFNEVAASYKLQTKGRVLLTDLYTNLDSGVEWWKPDWNRLKPTLDKIMRTSRASFKKPTTTKKK